MTVATGNDDRGVLYRGGVIRTVDPAHSEPEAVATRNGSILAVGSEDTCRRALDTDRAPASTVEVVDLGGRALLPGFNDVHIHPLAACFLTLNVDLGPMTSLTEVLDTLADRARITTPGDWVLGLRLTPGQLEERRLPTIAELDAVGAGRPVVVLLRDGHTSQGNTVALATAGIRGNRAAPPGGRFDRDASGRLTGVCRENATGVLFSAVPPADLDDLQPAAKQLFADCAARGVTSLGMVLQTDAEGPGGPAGALESRGMTVLVKDMPQGSHAMLSGRLGNALDLRASSSLHQPDLNRLVGGVKLYVDGTLEAGTAALHQPYTGTGDCGFLTMDLAEVATRVEGAHLAGLQACVHVNGDAATARVLDIFSDVLSRHPPDPGDPPRHRLEHAGLLSEASAARLAELGIAVAVQPLALRSQHPWLAGQLGPERARMAHAFRTLVDTGVVVAGSSDAPLEPTDVLDGIEAAVNRCGHEADQALTPAQAVELYTRNAAVAQRRDGITGTITEGKRADLVVLSHDPIDVPPAKIGSIEVCRTVIGGTVVHRAPDDRDL